MVKNYLTIAWRVLLRNKYISLINIFGLGIAIACCITAWLNVQYALDFDVFHEDKENIYKVNSTRTLENRTQNWGIVPSPLARVQEEVSGVKNIVRMDRFFMTVKASEEQVFAETVWYADDAFFDTFTFPMLRGNKTAHAQRDQIVISQAYAEKFFPDSDPIGQTLSTIFESIPKRTYTVGAVMAPHPENSSIDVDLLLPYSEYQDIAETGPDSWNDWAPVFFIHMEAGKDVAPALAQIHAHLDEVNQANPQFTMDGFYTEPLMQISGTSSELRDNPLQDGPPTPQVAGAIFTAAIMLLMSCFNFVNTSIAYSASRFKEIGIRKSMGSQRTQLIVQFLGENLLLSFLALLVGLMLAELFVPAYDNLWPNLELTLDYGQNLKLLGIITGLVLLIALGAGAYPAFYISNYNPVKIFRGRQQIVGTNRLVRVLFTLQLSTSVLSIICALVFSQNATYQSEIDLGFKADKVMVFNSIDSARLRVLASRLERLPQVTASSYSFQIPGFSTFNTPVAQGERKLEVSELYCAEGFVDMYAFRIMEGRDFNPELEHDRKHAVLVNQKMVEDFGWEEPVGQWLKVDDSTNYEVVGVIEDFYYQGFWKPIRPTLLRFTPEYKHRFLSVRYTAGDDEMREIAEDTWREVYPDKPISAFYADEFTLGAKNVNESIETISNYMAGIGIVISCLGLFALASLTIAKRNKELGIRKILGAGSKHITVIITKQFVILVLVASLIAGVLGYLLVTALLDSIFAYHTPVTVWPFLLSTFILLGGAAFTLFFLLRREIKRNPVDLLRTE